MIALLVATLQVSAILAVALGIAWLLRRRTASLRHAVIMIALTCAAIVPALGAWMPSWPLGIVPSFVESPLVPMEMQLHRQTPPGIAAGAFAPDAASIAPMRAASTPASAQPRGWQANLPAVLEIAYLAYLAGVALALVALVFGLLRLRWIAMHAEPLRSSRWQRRAAAIAGAFRVRRPIHLKCNSHSVLATWGVASPQILLPADAEDWPEDRVRTVLLHEMAHIRRNDWIVQILAGILRAIYWFNPLVWMACARLRQESEQACDDAALQQGEDETGYAGELLTIARFLNRHATPPQLAAPSMALRSTLRRRIASVLDPATSHAPATPTSLATVSAIMLAVTCAVAACGVRNRAPQDGAPLPLVAEAADPVIYSTAGTAPADATGSAHTLPIDTARDTAVVAAVAHVEAAQSRAAAPDGRYQTEPRSPGTIVAGILELVQSALADESLATLDEIARPITGLHHVQRFAQAVVDDNGENPANPAANYAEIINALINTANFASNITSTPRGAQLPKQRVNELAAQMRGKAAELSDAAMPTPGVTSVNVSTPERRIAISALDLAQTTLRDTQFVGPASSSWMVTELSTLERAAQSVLSDNGASQDGFNTKLHVFRGALRSATRSANDVTQRPRAPVDVKSKATTLLASVRRIMNQLDAVIPREQQFSDSYGMSREGNP